jgi:hypothetical protein
MKLKAPEGVGEPCVAGVSIAPRGGVYDVDDEIGALLIECFGFLPAEVAADKPVAAERTKAASPARRSKPAARTA